ncbi:MAG: TspO/MBR family protein [Acidobacteriota bacterium]
MKEDRGSADALRAVLVLVATAGTIAFNALAAMGYVNGVTPEVISNKYPTVLTPAGYAFSIWSLIYVGMIAFSIYQVLPSNLIRFRTVRTLYILSCLFNCGWIFFWHREAIGICLALITGLLISLFLMMREFRGSASTGEALFTKAPFGLYAGWVTAATLVNLAVFLSATGTSMTAQTWNIFGGACLILAAVAAVAVRFSFRHFLYPLAVAWAAAAIAIKQAGNTTIIVTATICVIICLVMAISFVMDQKSSTT